MTPYQKGIQVKNLLSVVCFVFFFTICFGAAAASPADQKGAGAEGENRSKSFRNTVTVTDDSGQRVTVQTPFKRIISLYGAHTENLFSLGLDQEIIGVSKNDHYPEKVKSKQRFSYHDDPEKFLAVKPDLILIRPMIARGYGPLVRQLERNGITVLSFQPSTVEKMLAYWEKLGHLTGKLQQARLMQESFQKSVDRFLKLTRDIREKKRVYFEAIHSRMKTFTPGSMPVFVLETAGGVNIAGDAKQVRDTNIAFYGKERLLSKAEKIDVYLAQTGVMNRVTREEILNEPGYRIIKAIKENEVYLVEETLVSRPTLRLVKGIYQVGRILYPDRFDEKEKMTARNAIRAGNGW